MTDLLEVCFWFFKPVSFRTWLFIIQLLWTIRLSLPYSLVSIPIRLYFFDYFYFFGIYISLLFFIIAVILVSLLIWTWSGGRGGYWFWVCVFSILILSWSRSLIFCYFLTYTGVSAFRGTSVFGWRYMWGSSGEGSPFRASKLTSTRSIF